MDKNSAHEEQTSLIVKMRMRELVLPPINDALVVGKDAPIGGEALRRALSLLHAAPFETMKITDDIIDEVLVRVSLLKKITQDKLTSLVQKKVKPFMSSTEVIHLDIHVELLSEEVI